MKNRWNSAEAEGFGSDLELRAYTSRLIGVDPELVLHGGGNTSVKPTEIDIFGNAVEAIYVKASGFDLAQMWTEGFTGLERERLLALSKLSVLSDPDMVREVKRAQFDPQAANASIEAIVHAVIPHKFVDHSHSDAILTISNSKLPLETWVEIFGESVAVLPYVKPGFDLAKQIAAFAADGGFERCDGLVLENHGLFTFHDDAKISYDRHIELVAVAQQFLDDQFGVLRPSAPQAEDPVKIAELRRAVGELAGFPVVSRPSCNVPDSFAKRLVDLTRTGTVTPEHVIHSKPFPAYVAEEINQGLEVFAADYQAYFDRSGDATLQRLPLNPHWVVPHPASTRCFAPKLNRAYNSANVAGPA
jgi:rhamnose utilization protein RhaD (predicted bifunctional aldolase and dehydrogenase)